MSQSLQPRPAATLALLRDGNAGLEVLMLQRTHQAVFMPGHYVFPGGAVDQNDHLPDLLSAISGHDGDSANRLLGVTQGGVGYLLAAVRECFEEAGVLLARDGTGNWLGDGHPALAEREAVAAGNLDLLTLCRQFELQVPLEGMVYLDHWITPPGRSRRFDTRFFVAAAPPAQTPRQDGQETIDHIWTTPNQALRDHRAGNREFAIPTRSVLERLMGFDSVNEVLERVRADYVNTAAGCKV